MGLRARLTRERGQSLVMVALMLVGLVGLLGLVIDVGNLYAQRRFVQNAADAAALAGARELGVDSSVSQVEAAVNAYAERNGAEVVAQTIITDTDEQHVAVTVTKVVPTYFMGVMGVDTNTVAAAAQAGYCPLGTAPGVLPLGIKSDYAKPDTNVIVWDSAATVDPDFLPAEYNPVTDEFIEAPNRGWINLTGTGIPNTSDLAKLLELDEVTGQPGLQEAVDCGIYPGSVGIKDKLLQYLADWVLPKLDDEELATRDNPDLDVILPVYSEIKDTGSAEIHFVVDGFAVFHIYDVRKVLSYRYVFGQFRHMIIERPEARCGAKDYGARIVQLER